MTARIRAKVIDAMAAQDELRHRRAIARTLLWMIISGVTVTVARHDHPLRIVEWVAICGSILTVGRWARDYVAWREGFKAAWELSLQAQKEARR